MENKTWFNQFCSENELMISESQLELFEDYCRELLRWNKHINLISRTHAEYIWSRHILGSIALLFKFNLLEHSSLVDVGTGGGLPGIPIAILHPTIKILLVDSIQKKVNAVKEILTHLQLNNVSVICARIEDLTHMKEYQKSFDYITARAVASMKNIVNWTRSILKEERIISNNEKSRNDKKVLIPRGSIILLKGGDLKNEIEEMKIATKPRLISEFPIATKTQTPPTLVGKKVIVIQP